MGLRASVEYYGVASEQGMVKNLGERVVKKGHWIQLHGEELIDVRFMDIADRGNCR